MKKCKYNKIYVLCPAGVKTGGTELLHQLVYQLNRQGAKAYLVYKNNADRNITESFEEYIDSWIQIEDIEDIKENLLVVPEIYCPDVKLFHEIQTAVWWLSVDNFLSRYAGFSGHIFTKGLFVGIMKSFWLLFTGKYQDRRLDMKDVNLHFCQSYYAIDYIKKIGIDKKDIYYLSDYINDSYIESVEKGINVKRENIVLYNPKKGYRFTKKIIDKSPNISWVPLSNMSNNQVRSMMNKAKVYIDFGEHPGKDRIPREAAASGCCVITGKNGSAYYQEDVNIPYKFKFDRSNSSIEMILETINKCLQNYEQYVCEFHTYRQCITGEKKKFMRDIEDLFFVEMPDAPTTT